MNGPIKLKFVFLAGLSLPSLIFESKAGTYLSEGPFKSTVGYSSGPNKLECFVEAFPPKSNVCGEVKEQTL